MPSDSNPSPGLFRGILPLTRAGASSDVMAGLTLAAMNIPQALGYTKIAGTPVVTGLYTLLLPLMAFAIFGSSRYLVVAADSATAAIMAGELSGRAPLASEHYVALAGMVAILTAGYLLLARLFKLGFLADFLSQTVLVGFLTGVGFQVGIAVTGQMLGIKVSSNRSLEQAWQILGGLSSIHGLTLSLSVIIVVIVLVCRHYLPRVPGPAIAVVGSIVCSWAFDFAGQGIAVLGPVTGGLPRLGIPQVTWAEAVALLPVAGACFIMILAQSAATAGAYATRHRQSHDENADLLGLSMANVGAALSGAFVVNGSPTQTAMVERSGGSSQVAHLTTAAVVGLVLLFFTGPLQYLPRCALSAVVFTVALGLIDLGGLRDISRESPGEFQLALGTALVVVMVGVEQGILLAMLVSLLRHVRHSYRPHSALLTQDSNGAWRQSSNGDSGQPGLLVFQFGADLFYANSGRFAEEVRRLLHQATSPVKWLIIDAGAMTSVDYSAARVLRQLHEDLSVGGVTLVLVHAPPPLLDALKRHRLSDVVAEEHIFDTLHEALAVFRQGESQPCV